MYPSRQAREVLITPDTWWAVPVRVFGYSDTPPPQPNCAVAPEERICVGLLICLFADEFFPDAPASLCNVLSGGQGMVFVPKISANGSRHVYGGDEAENAGNYERCSKTVIHHCTLAAERKEKAR